MSDEMGLLLTIVLGIAVFTVINYFTFKYSQGNLKRRLGAGIVFLLITPLIFFGTLFFVLIFDESGWGAGIMAVIFSGVYIVNGIIVLISSIGLMKK
ncbi:hypothetical protein [Bacillus sp. T33-2]|uniref:hypothetical protein n=1 Tax=Bacillus sp. T33-2 TaxID=2054168 RepID=UPI000C792DA7|nr:hypothetical protein [Bacillus sp. T33-2]PLR95097.1 hypothetical protein CVD19_15700 [Bacillus sp. T33-2]